MKGNVDLKALIRDVPDFPQPGVLFRDITPLLHDATAYAHVIDELTSRIDTFTPDVIVGIESRGFLFGAPVAYKLGLAFVVELAFLKGRERLQDRDITTLVTYES